MCVCGIILLWYYTLLFLFLSFAKSSRDDNYIVVVVVVVVVTERVVPFKIIRFERNFYDVFTLLVIMPTTIVHDIKVYYYDVNNIILFYLSFRMRAVVTYAYLHAAVAAIDTYTTCVNIIILCSDHETLLSATAVPHSTRCEYNATFTMHIIWHIMRLNGLSLKYNITELPWLYYYYV